MGPESQRPRPRRGSTEDFEAPRFVISGCELVAVFLFPRPILTCADGRKEEFARLESLDCGSSLARSTLAASQRRAKPGMQASLSPRAAPTLTYGTSAPCRLLPPFPHSVCTQMCVNVFAYYAEHAEEFLSTQQLPVQARSAALGLGGLRAAYMKRRSPHAKARRECTGTRARARGGAGRTAGRGVLLFDRAGPCRCGPRRRRRRRWPPHALWLWFQLPARY